MLQVWAYYCQEAKNEGEVISGAFTFFLPTDCQSMSYSDFKEIMTEIGDALSPEEVDRFFALVRPSPSNWMLTKRCHAVSQPCVLTRGLDAG